MHMPYLTRNIVTLVAGIMLCAEGQEFVVLQLQSTHSQLLFLQVRTALQILNTTTLVGKRTQLMRLSLRPYYTYIDSTNSLRHTH